MIEFVINNYSAHRWVPPTIDHPETLPKGDMPGDKVQINPVHIMKAQKIFPILLEQLAPLLNSKENQKAVISVHGGSGVGKSEIGSLLTYFLNQFGIGSYLLSGDNYPHRIPHYNDAERMRIFRVNGLKGLVKHQEYDLHVDEILKSLKADDSDANPEYIKTYPWLAAYQESGSQALKSYLGTPNELDFTEINSIISKFKAAEPSIMLKRMGREVNELWYENIDFSAINVLVIEWTHGNNDHLKGVDVPILLNSTPQETLEHRRSRNRDGATDSAFTTMVLGIEQELLASQAPKAKIIVAKSGEIMNLKSINAGPMLNAYPDSIGQNLSDMVSFMENPMLMDVFQSFYILPSVFNTDLDRGFSVIDYNLNEMYASKEDFAALRKLGIDFKFDFILNHASVLSKEFQDILNKGEESKYIDFFINWNKFWEGKGQMTAEGYIQPDADLIADMFFRKPGLPILNVNLPDGKVLPYWNTFYQEVTYDLVDAQDLMANSEVQYTTAQAIAKLVNKALQAGKNPEEIDFGRFAKYQQTVLAFLKSRRKYLGQMDLNIQSPLVWEFYEDTLQKLASYGAQIVRLDAFAYAPKAPGEKNFLNEPGTWELLEGVRLLADKYGVTLLPEIHSKYEEKTHEKIAEKGYMTYDFFLPGLIIDAFERNTAEVLTRWIREIQEKGIKTVNMLGCHDGIPLLDLKGLLPDEQIENLITTVVERGGYVKDLHGQKNIYYQVNATYFSALGESDQKLLLARAIQLFMPGKPQIWYLDLFAGKNNHEAVEKAGSGGHKEINRTNLNSEQVIEGLTQKVVQEQLAMIQFRNTCPAFGFDAKLTVANTESHQLNLTWENKGQRATLKANLKDFTYCIEVEDHEGNVEQMNFDIIYK